MSNKFTDKFSAGKCTIGLGLLALTLLLMLIFLFYSSPATAQNEPKTRPTFLFPLDCKPDNNCWIVNYIDVDPDPNIAKDYSCGSRTYENHKGTDIALRDMVTMQSGVDVFAAAAGTILRFRDGEEDKIASKEEIKSLLAANKGCGNGVFISHGNGWQSIYCHLKRDSVIVKENQKISAGEKIAQAGSSGAVEFPHLHFSSFYNGKVIDPFTGDEENKECGQGTRNSLWKDAKKIKYDTIALFGLGFTGQAPNIEALKIDNHSPLKLSSKNDALVLWMGYYGARKNDKIEIIIKDPDGKIFTKRQVTQDKDRARQYYYAGKKLKPENRKPGKYSGYVRIIRSSPSFPAAPLTAQKEIFTSLH